MWPHTRITDLFRIAVPIVQAPMAGSPNRPELVAAVSNAGGLGSLGLAYSAPDAIREQIRATRGLTDRPFGVNLFAPVPGDADPAKVRRANALLAPWLARYGLVEDPSPALTMPDFEAQCAAVLDERPAVFSVTFGALPPDWTGRFKSAGIVVVGTATSVPEAERLERDGADAIVAQGAEAGAHRGTFIGRCEDSLIGLMALVPAMADRVKPPIIAAGGIMDGRGVAAALMLGASGVQLGTAFLISTESGAGPAWRKAVLGQTASATRVTRVFSGRPARGVPNAMMDALEPHAGELPGFPAMNGLTNAIRRAAGVRADPEAQALWSGQGAPLARAMPAGELVRILALETSQRLEQGYAE